MAVDAGLRWLKNVSNVYLVHISLLLTGQQSLGHFFRYWPLLASHSLEDCANFAPKPEENDQHSANQSKCNTSSKPLLSIHKLTIHVIKSQIYLISQSLYPGLIFSRFLTVIIELTHFKAFGLADLLPSVKIFKRCRRQRLKIRQRI
jgi:hypothetical protein